LLELYWSVKYSINFLLKEKMKKVIWFTGLSASGKTTLANGLIDFFREQELSSILIDGDDIRSGLSSDLNFS